MYKTQYASWDGRVMVDAGDFLAVLVLAGPCRLVLDELRAASRMLSFAQPREFFGPVPDSEAALPAPS